MDSKELPNEPTLDEEARKALSLNRYFFLAGLTGVPICLWGDMRWHKYPWLIGLGTSVCFMVSSITDAVMKTRKDVHAWKRAHAARNDAALEPVWASQIPPRVKSLRTNPFFRAGVMGLPFCIFQWFMKHTPVFLLGGGFFAGLLMATLYNQRRRLHMREAEIDTQVASSEDFEVRS